MNWMLIRTVTRMTDPYLLLALATAAELNGQYTAVVLLKAALYAALWHMHRRPQRR